MKTEYANYVNVIDLRIYKITSFDYVQRKYMRLTTLNVVFQIYIEFHTNLFGLSILLKQQHNQLIIGSIKLKLDTTFY